jgi:hypothetical protein
VLGNRGANVEIRDVDVRDPDVAAAFAARRGQQATSSISNPLSDA